MTEDLKLIVVELNKLLETDYNLITFDSLSPESLLQVLVDVFRAFDAIDKIDVRENDPEDTNLQVMEALRKVQYRPATDIDDPGAFRRGLVRGEKKLIHPILRWLLENSERVKKAAYLARFLIPLELPPEALAMPDIGSLWTQYLQTMEDFKDAHRTYEQALQDGTRARELRNDLSAIETEIENVKKRIERTQARLDKVPQQELLLEAANSLRIEKERQRELQQQIEEQREGLKKANMLHERLQKELQNAKMAVQGATPQNLLESLIEETQVLEFMVQQKLPQELNRCRSEVQILQEVLDEPNITREDLQEMQAKIDELNREMQQLVEARLAEHNTHNDTLGPFRQQAAMVARNKEAAAEELDRKTRELREVERELEEAQRQLQETVGEEVLSGEELKQFVNTLRAKSNVYKQQRAELAAVKAEVSDLEQTLENLKAQNPTLESTLTQLTEEEAAASVELPEDSEGAVGDGETSRPESPTKARSMTELAQLVDGLQRAVEAARERVAPLCQQLRPLRERMIELKDEMESKKQTYDALVATLNAEAATMQSKITETEREIRTLEQQWQNLQKEHERLQMLLEKANEEMTSAGKEGHVSLKETLSQQIMEQETICKRLQEEKERIINSKADRAQQLEMWTDLKRLFEVKIRCLHESKQRGPGGTMSVTQGGAETFTLQ